MASLPPITEYINDEMKVVLYGNLYKHGITSIWLFDDITTLLRSYIQAGHLTESIITTYKRNVDGRIGDGFVMIGCVVVFKGRKIPIEWDMRISSAAMESNMSECIKIFRSNVTPIPKYVLYKIDEYSARWTQIPNTYGGGSHLDCKSMEPIHLVAIVDVDESRHELHIHTTGKEAKAALAERITSFATKQAAFPVFVAAACGDPTSSVGKAQTNTAYEHQIWRLVAAFL